MESLNLINRLINALSFNLWAYLKKTLNRIVLILILIISIQMNNVALIKQAECDKGKYTSINNFKRLFDIYPSIFLFIPDKSTIN